MAGKIRASNLNKSVVENQTDNPSAAVADDDSVLILDKSLGQLRKTNTQNIGLKAPTVTAVSPTNVLRGEAQGTVSFTVTGTQFNAGTSAKLITNGGSDVQFNSVTIDSLTQLTCVANRSDFLNANEPYDVSVTNGTGLNVILVNAINVDGAPTFTTAAGSLGSCRAAGSFIVEAADPESGSDPQFALESGSFPPGLSITNQDSGRCTISGSVTGTLPSTDTVFNFRLKAFDANSNVSFRDFSITVLGPSFTSFTSSGTYSVPSGTTAVDVLVVAGGGGSNAYPGARPADPAIHGNNGGGGAGGLIFMPGFPVTPGGTVSVTVGGGGEFGTGQDSVFGTLTAKGGGVGKQAFYIIGYQPGGAGGSGGGGGKSDRGPGGAPGPATQPTQPGNSGAYGFGNPGGSQGGGGGGAGTSGQPGPGGNGGDGKAYTIADGTTSVVYAGGGGGSSGSGGTGGGGPNPAPSVSDQVQDGLDGRGSGGGGRPVAAGPVNSPRSTGGTGIVIVKS
tara:strand:- start:253 stop:1767 length:1515 start_codon:yes stop_codon:yes gene_type:complete